MKKALLLATIGAFASTALAGEYGGKAPVYVEPKAPIEECVDIGGSISAGYETDYIFYGARFARDSVWTDVNYTFDNFIVPINIGAWYLNGINGSPGYDELDLYAGIDLPSVAGFDLSLGYVHFYFPEAVSAPSYGEFSLSAGRSLGFVDLSATVVYALLNGRAGQETGAWYYDLGVEKTFDVTDAVALVLGAGVGYSDNYFDNTAGIGGGIPAVVPGGTDSGWNHYYVTASLPIELNCRATLTPYIGYSGAPDGWVVDGLSGGGQPGAQSDILHGGVSLSVSF